MTNLTKHLTTAAALLALAGCHEKSKSPFARPLPPAAPAATTKDTIPETKPAPSPSASEPESPAPAAANEPGDDVPVGPMFPPAQVGTPAPFAFKGWSDRVAYAQKYLKDAFPAGESRTVRFHSAKDADLSHQIKRFQHPRTLEAALGINTAFPEPITKVLNGRNNHATTKFLARYLTATDPKTATSAAELVIENIFYGDRSPQAKCVEIGNDFEAIMQYGYFDEAVAARREFLQARLDQVYGRAQDPKNLGTNILVYVGAPVFVAAVAGLGGRLIERGFKRGAVTAAEGLAVREGNVFMRTKQSFTRRIDDQIDRLIQGYRKSEEIILDFFKEKGMPYGVNLTGNTLRQLERELGTAGQPLKNIAWIQSGEPGLRYFIADRQHGHVVDYGGRLIALEYKDGSGVVRYATTDHMPLRMTEGIEEFLKDMRPATAEVLDAAGHTRPSDVPMSELSRTIVNPTGASPRAFRLNEDPGPNVRITDDAAHVDAPAAPAAPAADTAATAARPRGTFNTKHAVFAFAAGELSIMGVNWIGTARGREDEMNINALYLGGQIGNSVRPHPTAKTEARGQ